MKLMFALALALMVVTRQLLANGWSVQWSYYAAFENGQLVAPYAYRLTDGLIALLPVPIVGYALALLLASWVFITGAGALYRRLGGYTELGMVVGTLFALFAVQVDVFVTTHVHHAALMWVLIWLYDSYRLRR